ncbi:MAG: hypothetical protein JNL19_08210 [Burkholderiales bacterium]|nr:hypothetical protein [Burkholderiales bacterium]
MATVLATLTLLAATPTIHAACNFNADQHGPSTATGTTDALILLRTLRGLSGPSRVTNAVHPGATDSDVATYLQSVGLGLDVDGDGVISTIDIIVIARHLFGFRGDALMSGYTATANAVRKTGAELQAFLDNGCVVGPDPQVGITVWNAMNAQLALGTAAGVNAAKQYMTDTAVENYADALTAIATDLPALIASYSQLVPRLVQNDIAEYWVSVPVIGSTTGQRLVHLVTLLRMADGSWRVDSM